MSQILQTHTQLTIGDLPEGEQSSLFVEETVSHI
jgi:hypothetical protein